MSKLQSSARTRPVFVLSADCWAAWPLIFDAIWQFGIYCWVILLNYYCLFLDKWLPVVSIATLGHGAIMDYSPIYGSGWIICHFSIILVQFVFQQLNFILLFSYLIKYYNIMFIIIVFWLVCNVTFFFVPALLLSVLTNHLTPLRALFLPSSSVSSSYFILAVHMRECLGKHSYTSSQFPIGFSGTFFFRETK